MDPPPALACPADAYVNVWQLPYGEDGSWALFVSNDKFPDFDPAAGVVLYESFAGVGGTIEGLHWWGVSATYDDSGDLVQCPLDPGTFEIKFWGTIAIRMRQYYELGPIYSFTADELGGLTKSATGHVYQVRRRRFGHGRVPTLGLGFRPAGADSPLWVVSRLDLDPEHRSVRVLVGSIARSAVRHVRDAHCGTSIL